ncbi:hypothetical protein OE88DRAFT_1642524 [Heliocybe sulcata]|uniref:Uncharacterized protein n=1 Tax=Heliocybe sulcata TaxID=5364 RepID=A0A5C3NH16_9AGAM|nr:hypothetical protein OE88DRAFT_1642524 [Heliocybe sulcata]
MTIGSHKGTPASTQLQEAKDPRVLPPPKVKRVQFKGVQEVVFYNAEEYDNVVDLYEREVHHYTGSDAMEWRKHDQTYAGEIIGMVTIAWGFQGFQSMPIAISISISKGFLHGLVLLLGHSTLMVLWDETDSFEPALKHLDVEVHFNETNVIQTYHLQQMCGPNAICDYKDCSAVGNQDVFYVNEVYDSDGNLIVGCKHIYNAEDSIYKKVYEYNNKGKLVNECTDDSSNYDCGDSNDNEDGSSGGDGDWADYEWDMNDE